MGQRTRDELFSSKTSVATAWRLNHKGGTTPTARSLVAMPQREWQPRLGAVQGWAKSGCPGPSLFSQHLLLQNVYIFMLSMGYEFFGGRNHIDLIYLSHPNLK